MIYCKGLTSQHKKISKHINNNFTPAKSAVTFRHKEAQVGQGYNFEKYYKRIKSNQKVGTKWSTY